MTILAISGFSTSGKTYLAQALPELMFSQLVSVTTRPKRPGELEGLDYYFILDQEFDSLIQSESLIEWIEYCGYRYGLMASTLSSCLEFGLIPAHVCSPAGVESLRAFAVQNNQEFISVFIEANPATIIHRMIKRWQATPRLSLDYLSERLATSLQIESNWGGSYHIRAGSEDELVITTQKILDIATGKASPPSQFERLPNSKFCNFEELKSRINSFLYGSTRPRNPEDSRSVTSDLIIELFHN